MDKIGVQVQVIKSGELKDSGSLFRQMTDEERDNFRKIIEEYHRNFQDVVYESRKDHLSREDVKKISDGRVLTATQALKAKLIDEIGYFDSALKKILEFAALPEAKVISYTYFPKRKTNIYATNLKSENPLERESLPEMIRSFQSGFYYLWHPQLHD